MIYLLITLLFLMLMISYTFFERDFFSPPFIVCTMFLLSTLCALYNKNKWYMDLSFETLFVLVIGILFFILSSLFIYITLGNTYRVKFERDYLNIENSNQDVNANYLLIIVLFSMLATFLYLRGIKNTIGQLGIFYNITDSASALRSAVSYEQSIVLPSYANISIKFLNIVSLPTLLLFVRNMVFKNKSQKFNFLLITPSIMSIICGIAFANRTSLLIVFLQVFVLIYISWGKRNYWANKLPMKSVIGTVIIVSLFLGLFSSIRGLVGRKNTSGTIDYVTSYIGGSIQSLNLYLSENGIDSIQSNKKIGGETFYSMNKTISEIKNEPVSSPHLEFRYSNGISLGNVYTAFRNYLHDFGFIGLIVFSSLLGIIYSTLYLRAKYKNNNISLLVYSYYAYPLFLISIAETFFSNYISLYMLSNLLFQIIFFIFLERSTNYKVDSRNNIVQSKC